jgi:hypothetical protein
MDRLTDIDQTQIDTWRANNNAQPGDPAVPALPGCNLKIDDHVLMCGFLPLVIYGVEGDGTNPECFMGGHVLWFGEGVYPFLISDITDRIGPPPGNEGMPIYDPPPEEEEPEEEVP